MKKLVMITALIASMIALSVDAQAGTVTANITYTTQTVTAAVTSYVAELWVSPISSTTPVASQTFTTAPSTVTFNNVNPGTYLVKVTAKDGTGASQGSFSSSAVTVPAPTASIPTGATVTAAP